MGALIHASAGFALGFAGSAHCVVMCGPLVLLAGRRHAALYHAGRIAVYIALGLTAASIGHLLTIAGGGRVVSVTLGVALLVSIARASRGAPRKISVGASITRVIASAHARTREWQDRHPLTTPALLGLLNGLLPCGLVYVAAAGAAGLSDPVAGASFMAGFGAGTLPLLALVSVAGGACVWRVRPGLRWLTPVAVATVGLLLMARGLAPHVMHGAPNAPTHEHRASE